MTPEQKHKLHAGKNLAAGSVEIISGALTSLGKGLLGSKIPPALRPRVGGAEIKKGIKDVKQGWKEWNE